jgi:hypothetical protein
MRWCASGVGQQQSRGPLPAARLADLPAGGRQEGGGLAEGDYHAGRLPHLSHPLLEPGARLRGRAVDGNADREEAAHGCDLAELCEDAFILLALQVDGDAFE